LKKRFEFQNRDHSTRVERLKLSSAFYFLSDFIFSSERQISLKSKSIPRSFLMPLSRGEKISDGNKEV
jgi:hypothetical protein